MGKTDSPRATPLTPPTIWHNQRATPRRLSICLALCLCALSACGSAETRISLSTPAIGLSPPPAEAHTVSVTLLRARDLRTDRTSLGGISQIFEREVRTDTDVAGWVADSLAASLTQAGYGVTRAETMKDATTPIVLVLSVTEVATNCTAQISSSWSCATNVTGTIEIYKNGRGVQRGSYSGKYTDSFYTLTFPTASEYQHTFDGAMHDFLAKALPGVTHGINAAAHP